MNTERSISAFSHRRSSFPTPKIQTSPPPRAMLVLNASWCDDRHGCQHTNLTINATPIEMQILPAGPAAPSLLITTSALALLALHALVIACLSILIVGQLDALQRQIDRLAVAVGRPPRRMARRVPMPRVVDGGVDSDDSVRERGAGDGAVMGVGNGGLASLRPGRLRIRSSFRESS